MRSPGRKIRRKRLAFTLVETMAAIVVATMIFSVLLMVYDRARVSTVSIARHLDDYRLPSEILQRIAEDVDRLTGPGSDARMTIENKTDNGYETARLTILNQIYDGKDKAQPFEKVIWQANYDPEVGSMILYRSHTGLCLEDKLLDTAQAEPGGEELFIGLCCGVTMFSVEVPKGDEFLDKWTQTTLPKSIVARISFEPPVKGVTGELEIDEQHQISRTIAIDRTRKIGFQIVSPDSKKAG